MEDNYIIGNSVWRLLAVLTLPMWIVPAVIFMAAMEAWLPLDDLVD